MNPDVVEAVDALVAGGVLPAPAAVPLRRAASGSHISVDVELRGLLWAGVFLVTTGVGILIRENFDRIGPVAIAVVLGACSLACLTWAWRRAGTPSFVFDSVLLLGALLAAADLAFIEVKFTPLGAHWAWHLLIVAAGYAGLAFRSDSKSLFSLSLTSLAAWRGVSIAGVASPWRTGQLDDRFFFEALICGIAFLAVGKALESWRIRPQFEPVATWLGWILIIGALLARLDDHDWKLATASALLASGAVLAWFAWDERSLGRYALGVGAAATAVGALIFQALHRLHVGEETTYLAVVVLLAAAVLVLILRANHALKAAA